MWLTVKKEDFLLPLHTTLSLFTGSSLRQVSLPKRGINSGLTVFIAILINRLVNSNLTN
jgi:hypothetical protein